MSAKMADKVPGQPSLDLPNEIWRQILEYLADFPIRDLSVRTPGSDTTENDDSEDHVDLSDEDSAQAETPRKRDVEDRLWKHQSHPDEVGSPQDHTLALRWLLNFSACSRRCRVLTWDLIVPKLEKHGIRTRDYYTRDVLRLLPGNLEGATYQYHPITSLGDEFNISPLLTMRTLTISITIDELQPSVLEAFASCDIELHTIVDRVRLLEDWESWRDDAVARDTSMSQSIKAIVALFTSPCLRSIRFTEEFRTREAESYPEMLWWQSLRVLIVTGPVNLHTIEIEGTYHHGRQARKVDAATKEVITQVRSINKARCKLRSLHVVFAQSRRRDEQDIDFPETFSLADIRWLMNGMDLTELQSLLIQQYLKPDAMRWLSGQRMPRIQELDVHSRSPATSSAAIQLLKKAAPLKSLSLQCSISSAVCQSMVHLHGSAIRKLSFPWADMRGRKTVNMDLQLVKVIVKCCPRLQFLRIAIARSPEEISCPKEYETIRTLRGLPMLTHLQLGLDCTPLMHGHATNKSELRACYGRVLRAGVVDEILLRQIWDAVFGAHNPGPLLLNPRELQVAPVYCLNDTVTPQSDDRYLLWTALRHLGTPQTLQGFGTDPTPDRTSEEWRRFDVLFKWQRRTEFVGRSSDYKGDPVWHAFNRFIHRGRLRTQYITPQATLYVIPEFDTAILSDATSSPTANTTITSTATFGTLTYAQVVRKHY